MLMFLAASVLYLSPVVGTGTAPDPYRLSLNSYMVGPGYVCIPSNVDGTPTFTWGLAVTKQSKVTDASILRFPVQDLDTPLTVTDGQWLAISTVLTARGVNMTGLSKTSTLRAVGDAMAAALGCGPGFLDGRLP